jgi:aspartyl-tRNA(Asn)/glutamyl-tRNA(Gln) amidotransferase subunit C
MSNIDENELLKLAKLCRIACSEEEKKKLLANLKNVISYVAQLQAVDTEGVAPCNTVLDVEHNAMREDEVAAPLPRELFLSNAPSHVGGMIRVPPIIKFTNQ